MQIRISQDIFSSLLSRTQSVLERKSTRPILENVLLEAYEGNLRLSATDLRVSLTQQAECVIDRPGSVSVPGRTLHEIVREMPKKDVNLEAKENQWITVSAEKSVFHLPGAPSEEYPTLPPLPETFLTLEGSSFRKMLEKTLFAASSDESRIYLCGVYAKTWTDEDGGTQLRMVATDGHRLSLVDRPIAQDLSPFREGVIIPKKGLSELKGLLEGTDEPFEIASSQGRVFARVGTTSLAITLIDATFPNYEQVIPPETGPPLGFHRSDLIDALRRVSLLSDQETHSVVLETAESTAVFTSANAQMGDAREEVAVTYDGEAIKLAFNAGYVLDALRVIEGDEVTVSASEPLAPCTFRSPSDPGYLAVVMPMRID